MAGRRRNDQTRSLMAAAVVNVAVALQIEKGDVTLAVEGARSLPPLDFVEVKVSKTSSKGQGKRV